MGKSTQIVIFLVAIFATRNVYSQKKNSLTYQSGILNYFYDKDPVLVNKIYLKSVKGIRDFNNNVLSRSRSLNYSRDIGGKSNMSIIGGLFRSEYTRKSLPEYENTPTVLFRKWYFLSLEFNRLLLSRNKLQLFYGVGLIYRHGFEVYHVNSYPAFNIGGSIGYESNFEFISVKSFGTAINLSIKYEFWKRFFLFSKLDTQYYAFTSKTSKDEFKEMENLYASFKFTAPKKVNHTFTIGIGVDF